MRHLTSEQLEQTLQAIEDRQPRPHTDHLSRCAECCARLSEMEREARWIDDLLEALDEPLSRVEVESLIRRSPRPRLRPVLAAAALAGILAVGAAAAVPGFPLRRWLERTFPFVTPPPAGTPSTSRASGLFSSTTGVIIPAAQVGRIVFQSSQTEGTILVAGTPGDDVKVEALEPDVHFAVEPGTVVVENHGATGSYRVFLPDDVRDLEVRVADGIVYRRSGGRATAVVLEQDGAYVLPFPQSDSLKN